MTEKGEHRGNELCRTMVYKVQSEIGFMFQETAKEMWCTRQEPSEESTARDYILDSSLQQVIRIMDSDIDINLNVNSIQIGHTVTEDWNDAMTVLLYPEKITNDIKFIQTDILEPTSFTLSLILKQ